MSVAALSADFVSWALMKSDGSTYLLAPPENLYFLGKNYSVVLRSAAERKKFEAFNLLWPSYVRSTAFLPLELHAQH